MLNLYKGYFNHITLKMWLNKANKFPGNFTWPIVYVILKAYMFLARILGNSSMYFDAERPKRFQENRIATLWSVIQGPDGIDGQLFVMQPYNFPTLV